MSRYASFGLDTNKRSQDIGEKQSKVFCVFCNQDHINIRAFSLCFSNWVICPDCLINSTNIENMDRWQEGDYCFSCKQKDIIGYTTSPDYPEPDYLCKCCIDMGRRLLSRPPAPVFNRKNKQIQMTF